MFYYYNFFATTKPVGNFHWSNSDFLLQHILSELILLIFSYYSTNYQYLTKLSFPITTSSTSRPIHLVLSESRKSETGIINPFSSTYVSKMINQLKSEDDNKRYRRDSSAVGEFKYPPIKSDGEINMYVRSKLKITLATKKDWKQ